jgi:hypothetical protein
MDITERAINVSSQGSSKGLSRSSLDLAKGDDLGARGTIKAPR